MYHMFRWAITGYLMWPYFYFRDGDHPKYLVGFRDQESMWVRTTAIVAINNRLITTNSGSQYYLEDINQDYRNWLIENNHNYDPDDPLA